MFGFKDAAWAGVVCVALVLFVQCRPAWSVRNTVERDAIRGFNEAYKGSRYITGEIISPDGGGHVDSLLPTIDVHRFEVLAQRTSFTGRSTELVARQIIKIVNGVPGGQDASQEVHTKLERKGSRWEYTLFETRDGQVIADPQNGNPWARALIARNEAWKSLWAPPTSALD